MQTTLIVGIIVLTGFIFGEIATKVRLPKVTGYILAGVLLNPSLFGLMPQDFVDRTGFATNISLAFITFSVGGTLFWPKVRKLGKGILYITFFEAECAFLAVILGFLAITPIFVTSGNISWFATFIPLSILVGCLGSPTDPSATLAVKEEYKAKGKVSSTIMGAAAFDDVLGIINYSLAIVISAAFILHKGFDPLVTVGSPVLVIAGSVLLGAAVGFVFNYVTGFFRSDSDGALIVLVLGILSVAFGLAALLKVDQLLAIMVSGIVVVNFNGKRKQIFSLLERYIDELIFIFFFTLSGMHLNFSVLRTSMVLVLFFVVFRAFGKVLGTRIGATLANSPDKVKRYVAGGLIPQGGIVIGLALMIKQNPAFSGIADIVITVIIGATVIHELIGPVLAKMVLKRAGEI